MDIEQNSSANVAQKPRKKRLIVSFVLVCVFVLSGLGIYWGVENDFFSHAYYEIQNQLSGEIKFGTGTYSGDTDFGILSGTGTFHFASGECYEGSWFENQLQGYGVLSAPNAGEYSGDFSGSKKNGNGTFTWLNGDNYVGSWVDDAMSGAGTYTFSDGRILDGEFENNSFSSGLYSFENISGKYEITYSAGQMVSANITFTDGTVYSGGCQNGEIFGTGTINYPNGDTYTGEYQDGKRNGQGTYQWSSGDCYQGEWLADVMSGTGKYALASGEKLSGTFKDNAFVSGTYDTATEDGTYTFTLEKGLPVALKMTLKNGLSYNGGFSDGKFNGQGSIKYPSGDSYDGGFVDGVRSGSGTYTWKDSAYYTGSWSDDQMNGKGTYFYAKSADGYKLSGTFKDNQPDGECTYYLSSSRSYGTTWRNGKCVKVTE